MQPREGPSAARKPEGGQAGQGPALRKISTLRSGCAIRNATASRRDLVLAPSTEPACVQTARRWLACVLLPRLPRCVALAGLGPQDAGVFLRGHALVLIPSRAQGDAIAERRHRGDGYLVEGSLFARQLGMPILYAGTCLSAYLTRCPMRAHAVSLGPGRACRCHAQTRRPGLDRRARANDARAVGARGDATRMLILILIAALLLLCLRRQARPHREIGIARPWRAR